MSEDTRYKCWRCGSINITHEYTANAIRSVCCDCAALHVEDVADPFDPEGEETAVSALVAERVMGLAPGDDFGSWPEHDWRKAERDYEKAHSATVCDRCGEHAGWVSVEDAQWLRPGPCVIEPPMCATMLGASWRVIEHFRRQGYAIAVHCSPGDTLPNRVVIARGGQEWVGEADTVPLAICRAALEVPRQPGAARA